MIGCHSRMSVLANESLTLVAEFASEPEARNCVAAVFAVRSTISRLDKRAWYASRTFAVRGVCPGTTRLGAVTFIEAVISALSSEPRQRISELPERFPASLRFPTERKRDPVLASRSPTDKSLTCILTVPRGSFFTFPAPLPKACQSRISASELKFPRKRRPSTRDN